MIKIICQERQLYLMILFKKAKNINNAFYESVDMNKLYFKNVGSTKDECFYEYKNSKEFLIEIKNGKLKFDNTLKKQEEFLKKLNQGKIGKATLERKKVVNNLEKFYHSREEVFDFFRDCSEMALDSSYKSNKNTTGMLQDYQ